MCGAVIPPPIYLGTNYGGGNEDNGDLPQRIPLMYCCTQCPHWPRPPPEYPEHPHASPGQSPVGSLLLSPGSCCTRFYCALQKSVSQSCVSSGSSMVGLMATSSKRTYAIPKSAAPRAPVPATDHHWPVPPQVVSLTGCLDIRYEFWYKKLLREIHINIDEIALMV